MSSWNGIAVEPGRVFANENVANAVELTCIDVNRPLPPEQSELRRIARGRREAEMAEGVGRQHAAARRALDEALLDQERLDDVLDRVARLRQRRRDRVDADRPAAVVVRDQRDSGGRWRRAPRASTSSRAAPRRRPCGRSRRRRRRTRSRARGGAAGRRRAACRARAARSRRRPPRSSAMPSTRAPALDDLHQFLGVRNRAGSECRSDRATAWSAGPRASWRRPA